MHFTTNFNYNLFQNPLNFQKHCGDFTSLFQLFISFMVFSGTQCIEQRSPTGGLRITGGL